MLLLVSNKKRDTYRYRRKLYRLGLRFENGKWRLKTADTNVEEEIAHFCKRKHLHYECIDDKYVRSNDYRKNLIINYKKKDNKFYRCAYCGKKLTNKTMTVDHIIPIDKVQHDVFYRRVMKILKIKNINDVNNLAPACERCNKKKGRKLKGYLFNGITGRTYKGVIIRRTVKAVATVFILSIIVFSLYYAFPNQFEDVIFFLIDNFSKIWRK